ncbi:MAG: hypothetical protein Q9191_005627 [Dirinaria sp. TL-2023a]
MSSSSNQPATLFKRSRLHDDAPSAKRPRFDEQIQPPSPTPKTTVFDVLDHDARYTIFESIASLLNIADIASLSRTCKQLSSFYQALLPAHWNVDRRLRRFVRDPKALRSQMGRHDALISGSFAVQFFERVTWKESDLDIFVEQRQGAIALENHLCKKEDYDFVREGNVQEYLDVNGILSIRTLIMQRPDSTEAKVQLIQTKHQPLLEILRGFYTTLVVNVITWNKAYALFPQPSFVHHKAYMLKPINDYFGKLVAKYDMRGWTSQGIVWPEDKASHGSILEHRRLGDRFTWTVPFNTEGVRHAAQPDSVLEYSNFRLLEATHSPVGTLRASADEFLIPTRNHNLAGFYRVRGGVFKALTLKYRYISADAEGFWYRFAGPRLEKLSYIELYKTASSARPQSLMDDVESDSPLYDLCSKVDRCGIAIPSYDHEIPGWYATWERQLASEAQNT